MSTRKHGLMSSGKFTRVVALLLALGLVVGFAASYLSQAGVPGWMIVVISLVVLAVPVVAVLYSGDRDAG